MKNFSEDIKNITTTKKEQYLNGIAPSVGLSKERLTTLFESFETNFLELPFDELVLKFENSLKPKHYNFHEFKKTILEINDNQETSEQARYDITNKLLDVIQNCSETADINTLLEIVCFILRLKSDKFAELDYKLDYLRSNLGNLFEDTKIDFTKVNVLAYNTESDNHINSVEDKRFYESLKHILARNNPRWGGLYHLENTYNTIVNFLNKETERLVNDENMVTSANDFHENLIRDMLTKEQLNPMYRSIDVLRQLVPDIQTLIFDCMLLVHEYVRSNQSVMEFVSRHNYIDYIEATKTLYSNISSSKVRSKLALHDATWQYLKQEDKDNYYIPACVGFSEIFENFRIDTNKFDIWALPVRMHTVIDCIHIIKGAETEVTLPLRKVINLYVTKSMNIVRSTEKIILEQKKNNKYKTNY